MVVFNTVNVDGMVVRTAWDEYHAAPVELFIALDYTYPRGRGITEGAIRRIPIQSMHPDTMKAAGSLKVVGDWIEKHKPHIRQRPEDPETFYAHIALFFVLAIGDGEKGVTQILANYAGVRPTMAQQWIVTARRLGMLTPNIAKNLAGRACGNLTDKARMVLASQPINDWTEELEAA